MWAQVDSNYRPHAYQACALTKLSYRPGIRNRATRNRFYMPAKDTGNGLGSLEGMRRRRTPQRSYAMKVDISWLENPRNVSLKGGDPAAGSPTATLLRLHPSR